jgi:Arc/MetJ-type ribon-helix-helix transcriptional regulator
MVHSSKLKKATFALPESLLNRLRTLVETERVTSVNAVVREAVEKYVTDFERESFRKAMAEAAKDPEFMRDLGDTDGAFQHADAETAKRMPQW